MAPPPTGTIHTHVLADGTRAFHLRVRHQGERVRIVLHELDGCRCGCGGGWNAPAARTELGNVLAKIRVGVWQRSTPAPPESEPLDPAGPVPTFGDYADWWLNAKLTGEIGTKPIAKNTEHGYRGQLRHLVRFFGRYRLDQIDRPLCQRFKAHKLQEARELREALEAGAEIRDRSGRRAKPLGPGSLRRLIGTLAAIIDEAIEDGHLYFNPARGRRMKVHVPKPRRSFLEADELAALLAAASQQDRPLSQPVGDVGPTAKVVAALLARGARPAQIADQLGLARSTVTFHTKRLGAQLVGRGYVGRRVVCEILGRTGVRASELCDIRIGHLHLHDPGGARFRIPDSKTETGIREVQMTPALVEAVVDHLDRLQRAGHSTDPSDYLVQNRRGGRLARDRVGTIVGEAAALATQQRAALGLPALPSISPHSLRRTYISIALRANQFDVKWVMSQVGHADSRMTMDVYAQLEQRVDRSHGINFDRLLAASDSRGARRGVSVVKRVNAP